MKSGACTCAVVNCNNQFAERLSSTAMRNTTALTRIFQDLAAWTKGTCMASKAYSKSGAVLQTATAKDARRNTEWRLLRRRSFHNETNRRVLAGSEVNRRPEDGMSFIIY